ncbi:MAG: hypothetical protein HY747_06560 [Elusimicrobia bacterium]|nr:hypothetical protein [Elusimicrobiota bacterium]
MSRFDIRSGRWTRESWNLYSLAGPYLEKALSSGERLLLLEALTVLYRLQKDDSMIFDGVPVNKTSLRLMRRLAHYAINLALKMIRENPHDAALPCALSCVAWHMCRNGFFSLYYPFGVLFEEGCWCLDSPSIVCTWGGARMKLPSYRSRLCLTARYKRRIYFLAMRSSLAAFALNPQEPPLEKIVKKIWNRWAVGCRHEYRHWGLIRDFEQMDGLKMPCSQNCDDLHKDRWENYLNRFRKNWPLFLPLSFRESVLPYCAGTSETHSINETLRMESRLLVERHFSRCRSREAAVIRQKLLDSLQGR